MKRAERAMLLVVLAGASVACAEEPPYKRLLQGDDAKKAQGLQKQVGDLWTAGKFAEALQPAEEILALRKRVQGEGHWEVADAAHLVQTLRRVARLPAAEQQKLAAAKPTEAKAGALDEQGKYAQAEPLFRKVLAIHEEVLGPKHPDTALSCSNLAANLDAQGKAQEAEPLHRQALAICEEVLGPKHLNTAQSCFNLATNLHQQGRAREAEPLLRKTLAICEEVLGPKHPHTASCCNNLASILDAQGKA
jgi:tetratricopeptide (TPR) repeat protein